MSKSDLSSLFPLRLTPFEELMFRDGTKNFPMQFYLQVKLKGVVDQDVLRVAVAEAFQRHPLLNAKVTTIKGRLCWVWAGDDFPKADWDTESWRRKKPWQQTIDLTQEIGLKVWAEQHADAARLTLQYHHACCDGIGAAQFLQDVAVCYAREYASRNGAAEMPPLKPLDLSLLHDRNAQAGRRVANLPGGILRRARVILKYTLRYLRQEKVPFNSKRGSAKNQQHGLCIRQLKLDRRQTRLIRDAAKELNCSVCDLLISELILLGESWNRKLSGKQQKRGWLRQPTGCVLVPVSLRGPNDDKLPACNVVSYVFMARDLCMTNNPTRLRESIRDEMQQVHQYQAGWMFIQALESLKRLPGGFSMMIRSTNKSCMSSTVLSHMGNLLNAIGGQLPRDKDGSITMGNLSVDSIYGVPPLRQGTSVVFSSMMIDGCLNLCVRCCEQTFSEDEAVKLVEHLRKQLERICGHKDAANV